MAKKTAMPRSIFDASEMTTWQHERKGYVKCRALNHAWFDIEDDWEPQFGTPLVVKCERCGSLRRDILNRYGEVEARYYIKPSGYDLTKDDFMPTRSDYRRMLLEQRS